MASLMKSVDVIQEVKILPWAKPSQQPGSEARWSEETMVRSRVDRVDRVCIEPRKLFESCGPERINKVGALVPCSVNRGQFQRAGTQYPSTPIRVRHDGGHRVLDQIMPIKG